MRRLKTVRRPPIYPKTPGHLPCSSLTHPLPLSSRRPSVSFGGFGLRGAIQGEDPLLCDDPQRLLALLGREVEWLPPQYGIVIVDSITYVASHVGEGQIIRLFADCKRMGKEGKTIILVAHSVTFREELLARLSSLCSAHLSLQVEYVMQRSLKTLRVHKVWDSELSRDNAVSFEVEPEKGITPVSVSRVKV